MSVKLECKHINKVYGGETILNDISFCVEEGEFLSILGTSGCGKTTLLRCLIGLEKADSGEILKEGKEISGCAPSHRGMGIIFQNYALFPNMTVLQNVEYALKNQKELKGRTREIALKTLDMIGMTEQIGKKPSQLSGGQQQRVAIARTLAMNPSIVLLDEPISALDVENKEIMKKELKEIQRKFNSTMIYVTHDQEEAFALSDRIMIMNGGNVEQLDTPEEIFNHPKTPYVEKFVVEHLKNKLLSLQRSTRSIGHEE